MPLTTQTLFPSFAAAAAAGKASKASGPISHHINSGPTFNNCAPNPAIHNARLKAAEDEVAKARERVLDRIKPTATVTDAHEILEHARRRHAELTALAVPIIERVAATNARVAKLRTGKDRAAAQVTNAVAALSRHDDEERRKLEEWSADPKGKQPSARTGQRARLEKTIESARRRLSDLDAVLTTISQTLNPMHAELAAIGADRECAVVAILYQEAELLGHRYAAALSDLGKLSAEMRGLNRVLGGLKGAPGAPRPVRGSRGILNPPAICPPEPHQFIELKIGVPGFWLDAHCYVGLEAVVTADDINAASRPWLEYANAMLRTVGGEIDADAAEQQRLLAENAELRRSLDAGASSADLPNIVTVGKPQ